MMNVKNKTNIIQQNITVFVTLWCKNVFIGHKYIFVMWVFTNLFCLKLKNFYTPL